MGDKPLRTVIVVGAGASHEFGLPVGTTLQSEIRKITKMDVSSGGIRPFSSNLFFHDILPDVAMQSHYTVNDTVRLAKKANHISNGVEHAASIDNYLDAHRTDTETVAIGKLAIAACILEAEFESSLAYSGKGAGFHGRRHSGVDIEPHNTWIGLLTKALSAGRDFDTFCEAISSIDFVCFNYDRCIERYLFGAASLIYPVEAFDVEKLSDALNIIHPYGSLGDLNPIDGEHGTFGRHKDRQFLISASRNIRTFTEGMESDVRVKISRAFTNAENAVFLGYGFISVNDEFLFDEGPFEIPSLLGTTYGVSEERSEFIAGKMKSTCMMRQTPHQGKIQRGSPQLRAEGCADLIHRFSHKFEGIGGA